MSETILLSAPPNEVQSSKEHLAHPTGIADIGNVAIHSFKIDGDGYSNKYIETLNEDSERGTAKLEWGEPDTEGYRTSTVAAIKTNLPPEFFTVNADGQLYLSARSLDPLPPGSYDVTSRWGSSEMIVTDDEGNKFVTAREIPDRSLEGDFPIVPQREIIAGQRSNRVETFFGKMLGRKKSTKGVDIMHSYGFWEDVTISSQAAATPETMEKIISEHDLPVKIVDSVGADGGIPVEEFVESFAEGKLPIGPGDLGIYFHDVRSDDHMPGALIAGHEGMELVSIIAKAVIATGTQQEHGMFFDYFTAEIRHIAEIGGYIAEKSMERLCSSFDVVATAVGADVSSSQLSFVLARRFRQVGQDIGDISMQLLADKLDPPEKTEKTDDPYAIPF